MSLCPYLQAGCGGCTLLDRPYGEQLRRKQAESVRLLGRFGTVEPILGAAQPLHYRNKAILSFAPAGRGRTACGFYAAGSHRIIEARDCLLQDERLNALLARAAAEAARGRLIPYDEDRGTGLLRHMVARRGVRTGELLLTVVTAAPVFPGSRAFVGALRSAFPELVTVVQQVNSRRTSAVLSGPEKTLFGGGFLTDELCGSRFRVPAGAFYQINHDQTERLYETALDFAGLTGGETVLDAYCGIGTITLAAAKRAKRVLGVEINAAAVRAAAANARLNGADNVSFLCGDAGAELEKAVRAGARFDAVFLDPTRDGASGQFLGSVVRAAPEKIVYISCFPATQARDLAFLTARGYAVRRLRPVDMFPQTDHVETVVLMSRVKGK